MSWIHCGKLVVFGGGGIRWPRFVAWGVAVAAVGGCAPAPAPEAVGRSAPESGRAGGLEPGHPGSLRQRQISIRLGAGALQIEVTPLAGWVLEAAAPDTRERLLQISEAHGPGLARRAGVAEPALFLVSLSSRQPGTEFEPDDLHMVSRGLRERPLAIRAITPGWGSRRLSQQATETALYAYDGGLDLTRELTVVYQGVEDSSWSAKLAAIEGERARIGRQEPVSSAFRQDKSRPQFRWVSSSAMLGKLQKERHTDPRHSIRIVRGSTSSTLPEAAHSMRYWRSRGSPGS